MDLGVVLGALGTFVGAIASAVALIAKSKSETRKTEVDAQESSMNLTLAAMNGHMDTLARENTSLRGRVDELDKEVRDARAETARCEADKETMRQEFQRKIDHLERLVRDLQKDLR